MKYLTTTGSSLIHMIAANIIRDSLKLQGLLACRRFSQRMDHMDRTTDNTRQKEMSKAIVTEMTDLSPTVKGLKLKVSNRDVTFKAGQWVDFRAPDIEGITGYTMCSAPAQLVQCGTLDLAVKFSDHKITSWIHEKCKVGSQVEIRVGGDFYFDPSSTSTRGRCLLLIAGGVGINPMVSIIRYISDLQQQQQQQQQHPGNGEPSRPKACLLYSAKSVDELIFRRDLDGVGQEHPNIRLQYFVTGEVPSQNSISHGRMKQKDLEEAVRWMDCPAEQVEAYICGPGPMIDDMCPSLTRLGLPASSVHFERWW